MFIQSIRIASEIFNGVIDFLKIEFLKVRYTCCLTKVIITSCGEHSLHVDFRFVWIQKELPLHSLQVDLYLLWIQKALPPHSLQLPLFLLNTQI